VFREIAFAPRCAELLGFAAEIFQTVENEAAEVFSRVLGKRVKFQKLPLPIVRLALGKEFYQMFRWFNQAGFKADIHALKRRFPEVSLLSLEHQR
jgi:hypothetical protein